MWNNTTGQGSTLISPKAGSCAAFFWGTSGQLYSRSNTSTNGGCCPDELPWHTAWNIQPCRTGNHCECHRRSAVPVLGDISGMGNVYVITGRTDMRKSFDSLILLIQDTYQLDPYSKSVFLFCGRDTSKLKALYHDRDGWVLMHKRLDGEGRFQWPRSPSEARLITRQQLRWLLEGLSLDQPKAIKATGKKKDIWCLCKTENLKKIFFFHAEQKK